MLTIAFQPDGPMAGTADKTWTFPYYSSNDNAVTWTTHTSGSITFPQSLEWFRFHRGILEDLDGTLYTPLYGQYVTDTVDRAMLAKSTNGGSTWTVVSNIGATAPGFNETVLARAMNGSLLAVMRGVGSNQPMYYARSTDNGTTWTNPAKLPGVSMRTRKA